MTAPWQTMPDFQDGTLVDEGDLDPLVFNLNLLRRSRRVLAGRIISTIGLIHTTSGTTELNVPKLQISNILVEANRPYIFNFNLYVQGSVALDSFYVRVRQNTGLTGTVLAFTPFIVNSAGKDDTVSLQLPWKPAVGGTTTFFVSLVRASGSGTLQLWGNSQSAAWIEKAGDDGTEWALT